MSVAPPFRSLSVVTPESLPDYPISTRDKLPGHQWFAFNHVKWDRNPFRIRADLEVRAVFLELFCASQRETPLGTLPLADDLLAHAAGVPLDVWKRLLMREVGPLHDWQKCLCDNGEVRLMHPMVTEVALEAMKGRIKWAQAAEAEVERKRLAALPAKILRAGGSERMAADAAYVMRLDQHLVETLTDGKSRTISVVRGAMEELELGVCGKL